MEKNETFYRKTMMLVGMMPAQGHSGRAVGQGVLEHWKASASIHPDKIVGATIPNLIFQGGSPIIGFTAI